MRTFIQTTFAAGALMAAGCSAPSGPTAPNAPEAQASDVAQRAVRGQLSQGLQAEGSAVRAVDAAGGQHQAVVGVDGRFALDLAKGHSDRLMLVDAQGEIARHIKLRRAADGSTRVGGVPGRRVQP